MVNTDTRDRGDITAMADITAERCVLGGMLISARTADDILDSPLTGPDFYRPAHETIYAAIAALHHRREPADTVTVAAHLQAVGDLGRVGGPAYLHQLTADVPTAANAAYYATIVREKAVMRRLAEAGTRLIQLARATDGGDVADILDAAQAEVGHVADTWHATTGAVADEDISATVDAALDALEQGVTAYPTGWAGLDTIIRGWVPGTLNVVAARPGVGKSAIALQTALHAALEQGLPVGITSLEMTRQEVIQRACSHLAHVDYGRIQRSPGDPLSEAEWRHVSKAVERIRTSRLAITDRPSTAAGIRAAIRAAERRYDAAPALWVVDYLQLLTPTDRRVPREQQVAGMTRDLKLTALELKVPVLLLAQLNRLPVSEKRPPRVSDLRESGAVEQDADAVLLLDRSDDEVHGMDLNVIVGKNRRGPTGTVALTWEGQYQTASDASKWTPSAAIRTK